MKRTLKMTAIVLVICLITQIFTICATAQSNDLIIDDTETQQEQPYIVAEINQYRDENEKHFLLSDGKRVAVSYPTAVHYKDSDGVWQDIDNSLESVSDDEYATADSNIDVTLSKKMKQNKTVELNVDGYKISWGFVSANNADAQLKSTPEREGDDSFLILDDTTSTTVYEDAFSNVDIEYIVSPAGVKENIILKNRQAQNKFEAIYKYKDLTPVQVDDKTIELKNSKGKVIYTVSAPIMIDESGETSEDITISMTKSNSSQMTVEITADESWLNNLLRNYPVTVDPTVSSATISSFEFDGANDYNASSGSSGYVGTHYDAGFAINNMSIIRITDLPSIGAGGYVTDAYLSMSAVRFEGPVGIYSVEGDNAVDNISDLTWQNLTSITSGYADDIINTAATENFYKLATWNVTAAAQRNYRNGLTFVLKSEEGGGLSQFMTSTPFTAPFVTVTYINRSGISDKYSYHTQSLGRAGTAYINDLTGRLEVSRTDMSYPSEKMSASVGMNFIVYDLNEAALTELPISADTFKYKWRNSYFEVITEPESSAYRKVWSRGDGTLVYFSATQTTPEEGDAYYPSAEPLGYKLYTNHIEDSSGTKYEFYSDGRLKKIQNGDDETDAITITYPSISSDTFYAISTITDGDGKVYSFEYDENYNLASVKYKGTGTTELDSVSYSYDTNGRLAQVNYHGEISRYEYTSTGLISSITAPDGYKIVYEYYDDTAGDSYNPRVKEVTEYANDGTQGNSMEITYGNNCTEYVDANGSKETIIFDDEGNVVTTMDENGYAIHEKTDGDGNFLGSTSVTVPTENLLTNHSFENGQQNWLFTSTQEGAYNIVTQEAAYGYNSARIVISNTGTAQIRQELTSPEAGDYTLSAYAFADSITGDKGATTYAEVLHADGTLKTYYGNGISGKSTEWERSSVSFNVPENAQKIIVSLGIFESVGTAYFDGVQLEKHKRAYEYNMLENSDFTNGSTSWSLFGQSSITTATDDHGGFDEKVVSLTGASSTISQTVNINGKAGDSYTISGWFKNVGTLAFSPHAEYRQIVMRIIGVRADEDTSTSILREINISPILRDKWHKLAESVTLSEDFDRLHIQVNFYGNYGTTYVDGIEMFSGGFYDETTTSNDTTEDGTSTEETEEVPVETTDSLGRVTSYTEDGVTTTYEYDGNTENVIKESVSTTIGTMTQTMITTNNTSVSNGVKTEISTDALGNTTKTLTDVNTGNIISVVDGRNNSTDYEYNALQQLAELSGLMSTNVTASNVFTYEHDKIKTISHNGSSYTFNYNKFGDITSIYVGNQTLVSYGYLSNINRITNSITFGNGAVINYVYDDEFNLTQIKYGDTLAITYTYDELGNVLKTTDHKRGTVTKQVGDETQVWNLAETSLSHSYKDEEGSFTETIGNNTYTVTSDYNEESDTETVSYDGKTQTTTYDKFGRITEVVTQKGTSNILRQIYQYSVWTDSDGILRTSDQISAIVSITDNKTIVESYIYDANGNITEIRRNGILVRSYQYDNLNQLIAEYNYETLKAYIYYYSGAGNITSVVTLNVTYTPETGVTGNAFESQQAYTYGDSNWKDKLTAVDGAAITYDAIGNPISYKGYALTWEQGRQLKQIVKDGVYTDYAYDADGIRTSKSSSDKQSWSDTYNYKTVDGRITYESVTLSRTNRNYNNYFYYDENNTLLGFNHYYFDYGNTYQWLTAKYSYLKNLQGDIIGIVDESGALVAEYKYDAWGKIIAIEDGSGNDVSSNADHIANKNPMRYRGYYYDRDTGWYYLQSRYYDPELRRFLNADDVALVEYLSKSTVLGSNIFAYCENNPVVNVDRNGFWAENFDGFRPTSYGFTVKTNILFISAPFCYSFCTYVYFKYKNKYKSIKKMGILRMAVELYAHAVAYYGGSILSKLGIERGDSYKAHGKTAEVNTGDKWLYKYWIVWGMSRVIKYHFCHSRNLAIRSIALATVPLL